MESVHVQQIVLTSTCSCDVSLMESCLTCYVMCTLIFSDKLVIECHLYNRLPPFRLCPIMKVIVCQIVLVRTPFEVIDVVVLGRACRNAAAIKNRQPVAKMYVKADKTPDDSFISVIAEELNVKEVVLNENVGDIAKVKYDPNFAVINEKCEKAEKGKVIQAVNAARKAAIADGMSTDEAMATITDESVMAEKVAD